ncbi:MAG: phosphoglucosamine mutase [Rhodothermia bacterium]|nr:MAG: phosphoglucosamine mutase [Rhodothermia bacterium]
MDSTLIVSISGIRGIFGNGLDADVLVRFACAYGAWCKRDTPKPVIMIGRDGRVTGPLCAAIVSSTLRSIGCDVVDIGLAATPTVEMAVIKEGATGGIIVSASHNPEEWNALKLLNGSGEFLSPDEAAQVVELADQPCRGYVEFDEIGSFSETSYLDYHIERILDLSFIDSRQIANQDFRIVVDGINSVGGIAIPALLKALGVRVDQIICINCEPTGRFAHPAEPLPDNLIDTCNLVKEHRADLGIVVDPDADRLALIEDGGTYMSEELTQVLAADFLWRRRPGPFVTNLSSSRAIEDVAARYSMDVHRTAVGEINVVVKMHEVNALLGGEGNGGVILPDLHHGRDALVGVAMVLQHMAEMNQSLSELRADLPQYHIVKLKTEIGSLDPDNLLRRIAERYSNERIDTTDGVKIDFDECWVHMRKSNTEPIIRVYAESESMEEATALGERFMRELVEGT